MAGIHRGIGDSTTSEPEPLQFLDPIKFFKMIILQNLKGQFGGIVYLEAIQVFVWFISLVYYVPYIMYYCTLYKLQPRMVAIECGVVTQRATFLLLSLLCFVSLPNKRLGGPGNTKVHAWFLLLH